MPKTIEVKEYGHIFDGEEETNYEIRIPLDPDILRAMGWTYVKRPDGHQRLVFNTQMVIELKEMHIKQGWIDYTTLKMQEAAFWQARGAKINQSQIKQAMGF